MLMGLCLLFFASSLFQNSPKKFKIYNDVEVLMKQGKCEGDSFNKFFF